MKKLLCITAMLAVTGCAAPRMTQAQLANADYGRQPTTQEATALVKGYLEQHLLDPTSYILQPPHNITRMSYNGHDGYEFGYMVYYGVNAKNSFGGYVGMRQHSALIHNDRVIRTFTTRESDGAYDSDQW